MFSPQILGRYQFIGAFTCPSGPRQYYRWILQVAHQSFTPLQSQILRRTNTGPRGSLKPEALHVCSRAKYRRGTAILAVVAWASCGTAILAVVARVSSPCSADKTAKSVLRLNTYEALRNSLEHNSSLPPAHLLLMNCMIRHSQRSLCHSERSLCHSERSLCHSERSRGICSNQALCTSPLPPPKRAGHSERSLCHSERSPCHSERSRGISSNHALSSSPPRSPNNKKNVKIPSKFDAWQPQAQLGDGPDPPATSAVKKRQNPLDN